MADNTLTLSNPGQINKTGEVDAMFLKVFSGEVMTAFEETNVMKELHRMRTIDHGKSAAFPVMGKVSARYYVTGVPILGSNKIAANERTINIDGLLISIPWREAMQVKDAEIPAMCLHGARYKAELTQKQLSEQTGISVFHLSAMENCKRPIGKKNARLLADALNIDTRLLLSV